MAYWIIDDQGFGGTTYECSLCGAMFNDLFNDGLARAEVCPNCESEIHKDLNIYMKNGKIED